jgi:uncharacterized protein (TIGR00369 family)
MEEIAKYSGCFVCGDQNEIGLKARFVTQDDRAVTEVTADERFEGYRGIYHGGILSTLLDEVMIKAILANERFALTAEMTVRFHAPVKVGDRIRFEGWITETKGRRFRTKGTAYVDQTLVASAHGKYIEARTDVREQLMQSLD